MITKENQLNLTDLQSILSITEDYLDDEYDKTRFTIKYLSWDTHGVAIECNASFDLTPKAQDEILEGLDKLIITLKDNKNA